MSDREVEGLGYPVDYLLAEIRRRIPHRTWDDVNKIRRGIDQLTQDAYNRFIEDGGDISPELFAETSEATFGAVLGGVERNRGKVVRAALGQKDSKPSPASTISWKPREKVTGYLYQFHMIVDMSEEDDDPMVTNVFYSVRSRDPITYGRAKRLALDDFEGQTSAEGSFPGQPILGAIVTGVYKFERADNA